MQVMLDASVYAETRQHANTPPLPSAYGRPSHLRVATRVLLWPVASGHGAGVSLQTRLVTLPSL